MRIPRRVAAAFALTCAVAALLACAAREPRPPSALLIVLDTLRADHLGYQGYPRDTSPFLDRFASEHLAFTNAVSAAPWTPPSVATMFTGLYPTSHTMMPPDGRELARKRASRLPESADTLAEIFARHGYRTAAITSNPWITQTFGFSQGFERYLTPIRMHAAIITREAKTTLADIASGESPFFAVIHYLDPHDPYSPPPPYSEMFTGSVPGGFPYDEEMTSFINQYDGEIRFLDAQLGDLFAWMREEGLYENTAIVIVGDHGEQFMEHGDLTHGMQLFNEEINVPLLLKTAGAARSGVIDEVVSVVDVFPTLLAETGLSVDHRVPGLPLTDLDALRARRGVFSEIDRKYRQRSFTDRAGRRVIAGTSVRDAPLEGGFLDNAVTCFDSVADPWAQAPLADDATCEELVDLLGQSIELAAAHRLGEGAEPVTIDDETFEQLQSLGYVQ